MDFIITSMHFNGVLMTFEAASIHSFIAAPTTIRLPATPVDFEAASIDLRLPQRILDYINKLF